MSCLPCSPRRRGGPRRRVGATPSRLASGSGSLDFDGEGNDGGGPGGAGTHKFTLRQLTAAASNFREANLVGEGSFERVYKGQLDSGQVVAIKQLNRGGSQGSQEFLVECMMLMMLHHPHLVCLIGY